MYRVVDWEKHFENNRTKELKHLAWVPFPNRHDGDGYTELADHKNGAAHYGIWCAIVQVASKCDPRGTLSRDGARPHTAASLARMIRFPTPLVMEAINRLVNEVLWLEVVDDAGVVIPQEGATASQEGAALQEQNGTEQNRREQKGREGAHRTGVRFIAPTLDEVKAYAKERDSTSDPEKFHNHFSANGWKVGKAGHAMKDWKAAYRNWEKNDDERKPESRVATAEDLANYNPHDGGIGT